MQEIKKFDIKNIFDLIFGNYAKYFLQLNNPIDLINVAKYSRNDEYEKLWNLQRELKRQDNIIRLRKFGEQNLFFYLWRLQYYCIYMLYKLNINIETRRTLHDCFLMFISNIRSIAVYKALFLKKLNEKINLGKINEYNSIIRELRIEIKNIKQKMKNFQQKQSIKIDRIQQFVDELSRNLQKLSKKINEEDD